MAARFANALAPNYAQRDVISASPYHQLISHHKLAYIFVHVCKFHPIFFSIFLVRHDHKHFRPLLSHCLEVKAS